MTQTLIGISGSLRRGSFNTALLEAARGLAPEGVTIEPVSIRGIPLYDGDVEAESGLPELVRELKDKIAASSGLLIATPEYNNGIPGVLKNAVDWLSRPAADLPRVFGGLPVAVMGASPGRFGTGQAQTAWLPVLRALGVQAWFGSRMLVGSAGSVFDATGAMIDQGLKSQLRDFVAGFAAFARDAKRPGR
ncbi:MAG TPA: NADPH-dependent FMN reductase [Polyangiaceae bacterium]|nr:NADPH-dependent FMN reductase [Polyangiaceae bacterium]